MDAMARHYEKLTAPERFSLMVEAMARRDDAEAVMIQCDGPLTLRSWWGEYAEVSGSPC